MKKVIVMVVVVLLVAGCGQFAPEPTQTPEPTKTPTPEPITEDNFDLSNLFVQADLPMGTFEDGDLEISLPPMFDEIQNEDLGAYQSVKNMNGGGGGVSVIIDNDEKKLGSYYDLILDGFGDTENMTENGFNPELYQIASVGEKAHIATIYLVMLGEETYSADLVFIRCRAVGHIRFTEIKNSYDLIDYAKALDKRIKSSILCQ